MQSNGGDVREILDALRRIVRDLLEAHRRRIDETDRAERGLVLAAR